MSSETLGVEVLRVVVADDEPLSREAVRLHLDRWGGAEVVAECEDGAETVAAIRELAPDVVILDVQMPELDGFDVLEQVPRPPAIIFLTAYSEHAVRAFAVRAVDYLLKPIDENRFDEAMERARDVRRHTPPPAPARHLTHLRSRQGSRVQVIATGDIEWIEAADYYARVHTRDGRSCLVRDSLSYLSLHLDPAKFVRVHRSAIVAVDAVRQVHMAEGEVLLRNGRSIATSRSGRKLLQRVLRGR